MQYRRREQEKTKQRRYIKRNRYNCRRKTAPEPVPLTFESNWKQRIDDFNAFGLKPELIKSIFRYGFNKPSEFQALSILPIIMGRHVIAQSPLRSGKTVAFVIAILNSIHVEEKITQALVLAPTNEIAYQIYMYFKNIGSKMQDLTVQIFRDGDDVNKDQKRALELPHIAVCTPCMALNLIATGYLRCENIRIACVDDAHELLGKKFISQIREILRYTNFETQYIFFATSYTQISFDLIHEFIIDETKIVVEGGAPLDDIKQFYVDVGEASYKFQTLCDIYGAIQIHKAIIFANSIDTVENIKKQLHDDGFTVTAIHEGMNQDDRDDAMNYIGYCRPRYLVTTDIINHGIDFGYGPLVINYELPFRNEKYINRCITSRKNQNGKGVVINICDTDEMCHVRQIERTYNTEIMELPADISKIIHAVY